ncbi:MAG: hypothetical protein ABIA78_02260 [archaeon]
MKLYLHGTERKNLNNILKEGIATKYGKATLTDNPKYTISYSSKKTWGTTKKINDYLDNIKGGMIVVIKSRNIKVAEDSNLIYDNKNKIISGWPNRYKTEQFGFFPKKKTELVTIKPSSIVAIFGFNKLFIDFLNKLFQEIIGGKIDEKKIKKYVKMLLKILSNKKLQLIKPKISIEKIADSMVNGMIRNLILREIRQSYLSMMKLNDWKIINHGGHPVKLKNKKEIAETKKNLLKIIDEEFIEKDVKKEFKEVFG